MSKTSVVGEPQKPTEAKTYLCGSGVLGCGGVFTKERFRFAHGEFIRQSNICRSCELKTATAWGLPTTESDIVETALQNLPWYTWQVPELAEVEERTRARALVLAGDGEILGVTDRELALAKLIKPFIYQIKEAA